MSLSLAPVQSWNLMEIDAPSGTREPMVVHSGNEARAVVIVLTAGQKLGDHQVKENAWITVLEGSATVSAGGDTVDAAPGMLFRFDPDERHSLDQRRGCADPPPARAVARRGPLPRLIRLEALRPGVAGMDEAKRIREPLASVRPEPR